jgi:protein arginine kinase
LPKWLREEGPELDVVLSTRHRVARNIHGYPFPGRASDSERGEVARHIRRALAVQESLGEARELESSGVALLEKQRLLQRHMVSPAWCQSQPGATLWILSDGATSVMVNEEDHVRAQSVQPGLQVQSARNATHRIADAIGRRCEFAQDRSGGFLTASPSNYGFGIRTSALMHLPALRRSRLWKQSLEISFLAGSTIRGAFGEGTGAIGDLVQVSVERPLADIERLVVKLTRLEREARYEAVAGAVGRARKREVKLARQTVIAGAESGARQLGLVSDIRFGVLAGWIECDLLACSRWIADAGAGLDFLCGVTKAERVFDSVRTAASLRAQVRAVLSADGT